MQKAIGKLLKQLSNVIFRIGEKISPTKYEGNMALQSWANTSDKEKLRYDYPLDSSSIVFDLGGYLGEWSMFIHARYNPIIYVFEPVEQFASQIRYAFEASKNVEVFSFGLSNKNQTLEIGLDANKSSTFYKNESSISVSLKDFHEFVSKKKIEQIDLIKINIEGGEYDLLEGLLSTGWVKNIKNLQIQFHNFVPDAERRMKAIREKLANTHSPTYQFDFVWENWRKK